MLIRLLREERGSTIVLLAAAIAAIMLMAGLVVDVGFLYFQKTVAQTGVDAAALAGAADLPDQAVAGDDAKHYVLLNHLDAAALAPPDYSKAPGRIDLTYTKDFDTFFMKLISLLDPGSSGKVTIRVAAAAVNPLMASPFAFTIFSGSPFDMLPLNGSRLYVDGSVHSNGDLRINGSDITVTGVAEAHGTVTVNGAKLNIPDQVSGAPFIDMPDFSSEISAEAAAANHVYPGDKTFDGGPLNVDGSIHVNGSVTINGNTITGNGAILAGPTGDITINGNIISASTTDQVALYSQTGDIHINGNGITIDGIIYAPQGGIHINGNDITVNGRVVGNTVFINGTNFRVNGQNVPITSLPLGGPKLVQ